MTDLPRIERVNGHARLLVDGRPFLILGLQWDCDSCFSPEEMNPLFPHAARMGANTAALPVYWREIEPEPGCFSFGMVDERLRQARAHGLRVVLLWFATWKNACPFYAPADVRDDPVAYPRALDRDGNSTVSLCPSSEETWRRDRDALMALMAHLRDFDADRTAIMLQVENEPGLLGTDRCHCPACEDAFAAGRWQTEWGADAAEAFSVVAVAGYIERLAAEAKAVYPLPLYANVDLGPAIGGIPGAGPPSGGAVPAMLDLFRRQLRHIDLVAPDIYASGYRDFRSICRRYGDDQPLYVAEHSRSPTGRAERNVFYAIGEHAALGFDPWAIDCPFPQMDAPPLVDPVGGEWGPQAFWLRDSYRAIGRAVEPIVAAQGTERLFTFVQEPAEQRTGWAAAGVDVLVAFRDRDGAARGLIIQQSASEFLLIGLGCEVRFRRPRPDGRPVPVASAEWGRFEGDRWVALHPMRRELLESVGEPIKLLEPGVARVVLDLG
ncbi:MAG: DUF5597 domain-containing protein [Chloroflexota bacterium]|nr:DUF5597 domain-containing protein [Chloroflexota bacterium]